jgi:poly-gamma-glutamate synthesis protein (capsule biosynthesis protein)
LVLFPDHFNRADRFFATTTRGFDTLLGPVPTDAKGARHLMAAGIPESCLFGADHGIGSILPFLAHLLPGVPVLPVALSIHTTPAQWDALAGHLKALVDDDTLIVQSTDFSHYLPHHEARLRDQQVLNILAARDMEALGRLDQPDHIDSLAAMYLTLRLTEGRAEPLVLANRNQQEVSSIPLQETTSYMVILFAKPAGPAPQRFMDETILVLGGDMFLGRQIPRILSDELAAQRVEDAVLAASGGSPMIVNLEGVLLDELPPNLPHLTLAMPLDMAIDWAGRLNIIAMGLANNHAKDLGPDALARTQAVLDAAGIASARHGERLDLPGLVLTALRDLSNTEPPYANMIDPDDLAHLVVEDATRQSVAFLHWGREGEAAPGPRERALADKARRRGVSLVIGAHSHIAAPRPETIGGGDTLVFWSLGNFLFDQRGPAASGILVELRVFAQGTVFARPLPLPNLFDLALGRIVP